MRAGFLFPGTREGSEGLRHRRSNSHHAGSYLHVPDDGLEEPPQRAALPLHHRLHLLRRRHQPLSRSSGAPCAEPNGGNQTGRTGDQVLARAGRKAQSLAGGFPRHAEGGTPTGPAAGAATGARESPMSAGGAACRGGGGSRDAQRAAERSNFTRTDPLLSGSPQRARDPGARLEGRGGASVWPRPQQERLFFVNEGEGGECRIVSEQLKPKMIEI